MLHSALSLYRSLYISPDYLHAFHFLGNCEPAFFRLCEAERLWLHGRLSTCEAAFLLHALSTLWDHRPCSKGTCNRS